MVPAARHGFAQICFTGPSVAGMTFNANWVPGWQYFFVQTVLLVTDTEDNPWTDPTHPGLWMKTPPVSGLDGAFPYPGAVLAPGERGQAVDSPYFRVFSGGTTDYFAVFNNVLHLPAGRSVNRRRDRSWAPLYVQQWEASCFADWTNAGAGPILRNIVDCTIGGVRETTTPPTWAAVVFPGVTQVL